MSSEASPGKHLSLLSLTEDEVAMKETGSESNLKKKFLKMTFFRLHSKTYHYSIYISVNKLATQEIAPYVKKMDETSDMDPAVVDMLFQNGVFFFLFFKFKILVF